MAYSRYATELKDKDNNVYGIMDEEARAVQEQGEKIFHELMSVGTADALRSEKYVEDKVPYNFRRAICASKRAEEMLVGGTVAWNQLVQNGNFASASNWGSQNGTMSILNNVATMTPSAKRAQIQQGLSNSIFVVGHKYYCTCELKTSGASGTTDIYAVFFTTGQKKIYASQTSEWQRLDGIMNATTDGGSKDFYINDDRESGWDSWSLRNVMLFDLTKMFGSTIADALYAMGDAGLQWFRNLFPKDYYAYDAGSLQSVQAGSKVISDANGNPVYIYPLDSNLVLRGIPKLADGKLYYDGDEYLPDGGVTRKYGVVDLGNLAYTYANSCMISETLETSGSNTGIGGSNNVVCAKYTAKNARSYSSQYADKECGLSETGTQIIIKDSAYTDPATFKTAMSGVYLVYERATPTTEQADPFGNPMICDPDGTEEFIEWGIRDVAVPVGHITHYLEDLAPVLNNIPVIYDSQDTEQAIASFSDGAEGLPIKQMQIAVEPVQDLHGYDHPWPGGGGKNLMPSPTLERLIALNTTGTWTDGAYSLNGITITPKYDNDGNLLYVNVNGTSSDNTVAFRLFSRSAIGENIFTLPTNTYILNGVSANSNVEQQFQCTRNGSLYEFGNDTGSGSTAEILITDILQVVIYIKSNKTVSNSKVYPMIRLSSVSDASFAPYSNICPISGWTGAKVYREGENFFNNDSTTDWIMTLPAGTYYFRRYLLTSNYNINSRLRVYVNGEYVIASDNTTLDNGGITISGSMGWGSDAQETIVTTRTYTFKMDYSQISSLQGLARLMLTIGSMPPSWGYKEYTGNVYEISFPSSAGTVYGGTLTVNRDGTGTLYVDKGYVLFNGSESWNVQQTAGGDDYNFYILINNAVLSIGEDIKTNLFKSNIYSDPKSGTVYISVTRNINITVGNMLGISTTSAFKAYLAEHNLQVLYKLANPITYDLSAPQITTLLGLNDIWADTGDILSIDYPADTKLYIDKKFAELQALILEN